MKTRSQRWRYALGCAATLVFACSSSDRRFGPGPPSFEVDAPQPEAGAETGCSVACSRDLHAVVCGDEVRQQCPPDQGCAHGACVPACESAAANPGTLGCAFWTTPPPEYVYSYPDKVVISGPGGCHAVVLANSWDTDVEVAVEYGGAAMDVKTFGYVLDEQDGRAVYQPFDGKLAPSKALVLFFSDGLPPYWATNSAYVPCPTGVTALGTAYGRTFRNGRSKAFRVATTAPTSAYSIYPYGGAATYIPSATGLFPSTALGTDYLGVGAWDIGSLQLVATEDGTNVSIRDIGDYALAKGEMVQITDVLLHGNPIHADRPIAVFGGASNLFVPDRGRCCGESAQQQLPPLSALGSAYAAVGYRERYGSPATQEDVPWRIVGASDGTELHYEPEPPPGAPSFIGPNQAVTFYSKEPFVVRSQGLDHPFYLAGHMTGSGGTADGDAEYVNVVPLEQYLDSYIFFVDYSFDNSSLVIVRTPTESGFKDVTLDCAGKLDGFRPIGDGKVEYLRLDVTRDFQNQSTGSGKCGAGRHLIQSDGPFGITVWGTGTDASYGYPGGAGLRPINAVKPPH